MFHLAVLGGLALTGQDGPVGAAAARAKHLALLALLARAGETGVSRDRIASLLWPESEPERARHSVDQALYALRRALGADAIRVAGRAVSLNPDLVSSDLAEFLDAHQRGAHAEAAAAYGGPFLDGFHLAAATEWERWVDAERDRLHRLHADVLEKLAGEAAAHGDAAGAVHWWRRLAAAEPLSSRVALGLMHALEAAGDRAGALQFAGIHESLVRAELEAPVDPAVQELCARLRAAPLPVASPAPPPRDPAASTGTETADSSPAPFSDAPAPAAGAAAPRRKLLVWAAAVPACALALALAGGVLSREAAPSAPSAPPAPSPPPRTETHPRTRSPAALSLYHEGLKAHYEGDGETAHRLFRSALREDTTFAMAALYVAYTARTNQEWTAMLFRAVHLAEASGSDRERLLARASWASHMGDPSRLARAETLAIRYPDEPDGQLLVGQALLWSGSFAAAIPRLRRVVTMDAGGLRTPEARCRACEALGEMQSAYLHLDSIDAAIRTGHEWLSLQPRSAKAWTGLGIAYGMDGQTAKALDAVSRAIALHPATPDLQVFPAELRIRAGEFATADELLRALIRDGSPEQRSEAAFMLVISLRQQGRLREALAATSMISEESRDNVRALVLFDMGRYREAAELWGHLARRDPSYPIPPSRLARLRAWAMSHRADALAALGDTAALRPLAAQLRLVGAQSAYGRDQRLHHHARGLLLTLQGRPAEAVEEFRRAQFSPALGNTRTNLGLARALIAARQPARAIPVLQHGLRAGVTATALYTTQTELHWILGAAWEAAGRPDSAAVHYRWVVRAFRAADPQFAPRVAGLARRLAVVEGRAAARATPP